VDFDPADGDVDSVLGPDPPQLAPLCVRVRRAQPPDRGHAARLLPRDAQILAGAGAARRGARRPQEHLRHQQTQGRVRIPRNCSKLKKRVPEHKSVRVFVYRCVTWRPK
jgi:hypothetical protein